jgi:hypothetical protein
MRGFLELMPAESLQSHCRLDGQTSFLAHLSSSSSSSLSYALLCSMVRELMSLFVLFRHPPMTALQDPRLPCPCLSLGFF